MTLHMELEFDKYCSVEAIPKTVLLSPCRGSKVERRSINGKPTCANDLLSLEEDFKEIKFHHYRSLSCKNIPSRTSGLEGKEVLKRGSVCQSSREVRKMKRIGAVEDRRKIELSRKHANALPLEIVDSLCSSDDDCLLMESLNSDLSTTSVPILLNEPCHQEFSALHTAENVGRKIEDPKFRCDPNVGPYGLWERDTAPALHKSLSAKVALPYSPSQSESDSSRPSSPKARFSNIKKMFDPFKRSKSQRNPLVSASEHGWLPSIRRNTTLQKSLLNDFSNMSRSPEFGSKFVKKDLCNSASVSSSPAHLNGHLKLEKKHGVPFFEFSLKFQEEVLVAQTGKSDNALNRVYTFHSFHRRRKSNASRWGLKDNNKESSMVGQMQVSSYLCNELKDTGAFDNSMVMEFVVNDIAHERQNVAAQGNHNQSLADFKPLKVSGPSSLGGCDELDCMSDKLKLKHQPKQATDNSHFAKSTPSLEIAAVVIQIPFEKREMLEYKGGDEPNLLDLSAAEQRKEGVVDYSSPARVDVVIPLGNHSLPNSESRGPLPLLDRWRLGGGCDCGGWDMACPLTVFGNPNIQSAKVHPLMENQQPLELFVQGAKENKPALTMMVIEEGQYSVEFHAQLSVLQAFSICVAMLHCTEASLAIGRKRDKQLLQRNSLRVFIEEELKNLVEAVREEETRKVDKKIEEIPPSFKLNPPFSPIDRA